MKLFKLLPVLSILIMSQVNTSCSAETGAVICSFLSPLSYNGTQWKVRCENAPVYLARWENNSWRVLAVFDGTTGKYHLDWERPTPGVYVAFDSFGRISDSIKIGSN